MMNTNFSKIVLSSLFIITALIYAEETRFQQDTLLFSNGGGLMNYTDRLESLDIGHGTYLSKGIRVHGKYMTVEIEEKSTPYLISDTMKLSNLTNVALVGVDNRGTRSPAFDDTYSLLVGDALRGYGLFKYNKILAQTVLDASPNVHSDATLFIQDSKGPTYFGNVTSSGGPFVPAMSVFGQLSFSGILSDVKRVGINTRDPAEALSIVGGLTVSGKTNGVAGFFRPTAVVGEENVASNVSGYSSTYKNVIINTVTVKYVDYNALVHAQVVLYKPSISTVQARVSILRNGVAYTPPTGDEESQSNVIFSSSNNQNTFSLYPMWTGVLEADSVNPDTPVVYTIIIQESNASFTSSNGYGMYVLGLPNAPLLKPVEGSVDPGNGYVQETLFNQSSQAGNYITEDKISFKSGGFLSDSDVGLALIKDDGTNYKDLKATRLYADELYEMQVLKVFDSTDRYSFKVTSASSTTTFLGFNPNLDVNHDTPDMGSPVTFNIQAITGSTTPAKLILGDTNVGDSALVMSGTHVGIGRSSDTTAALAVAGNVSFTGSYGGTYGYTTSFTLDSNTGDFSNKNIFNSKSFTLAGTSTDKYNLIAIANASLRCTDTTQTVSMSISVDGVSSLNSIYSSTTENQDFPLMNIWSGELTGGSHTITVTVTAGASVQIRPTDSSVGEGATLVLVAVPKGDS